MISKKTADIIEKVIRVYFSYAGNCNCRECRNSRVVFENHKTLLQQLEPSKSFDNSVGYISFNVPGKKRQKIMTSRFLTRKLNLKLDSVFIEDITAKINQILFLTEIKIPIRIIKGKQITEAYRNRVGNSSCMTGDCADMTLMYEMNPDKISMIVVKFQRNSARAILWKLDCGEFYVDRIYCDDYKLFGELIYNFAKNKGWNIRDVGPSIPSSKLQVSGLIFSQGNVPYMDTFHYGDVINQGSGYLLNISAVSGKFYLDSTSGYLNICCKSCGNIIECDDDIDYENPLCSDCH